MVLPDNFYKDCSQPFVMKNAVTWSQLKWTLDEWKEALSKDNEAFKFPVRQGSFECTQEPLWERNCQTEYLTMFELFEKMSCPSGDSWVYFDYKHLCEWFRDHDCFKSLDWGMVGLKERRAEDSTLWAGTRGAHTPCHIDTYGCNMVAQLYGEKRWLLFPPEETNSLKPTRVPYEESSIYSQINFFCGCCDISSLKNIKTITLTPGDCLFVPKGWWHYVESLTSSISINTWIPLDSDEESRVNQSVVKCVISALSKICSDSQRKSLLNPNEDDLPGDLDVNLEELTYCLYKTLGPEVQAECHPDLARYGAQWIQDIDPDTLKATLLKKCGRSEERTVDPRKKSKRSVDLSALVNALCHPDVIALATQKLRNFHQS